MKALIAGVTTVAATVTICWALQATPQTASANHDCPTASDIINLRVHIDGRSQLTIQGNTVQWQHFDFTAPGRHEGGKRPTYVDCSPWYPVWPDIPDYENIDCGGCTSSVLVSTPPLPDISAFTGLEETNFGCREDCTVVEAPTAGNGFKLVLEFEDITSGGSCWYEINVRLAPGPTATPHPNPPACPKPDCSAAPCTPKPPTPAAVGGVTGLSLADPQPASNPTPLSGWQGRAPVLIMLGLLATLIITALLWRRRTA